MTALQDLHNYLKPQQWQHFRTVTWLMSPPTRELLATTLLDYMETGQPMLPDDPAVQEAFTFLTHYGLDDDVNVDPLTIHPLCINR